MWGVREGGSLILLEPLFESYTLKMKGFQKFNYWERLKKLKMLSIGRQFERYKILYHHKILYNFTDNYGLNWEYSDKTGLKFNTVKELYPEGTIVPIYWIYNKAFVIHPILTNIG